MLEEKRLKDIEKLVGDAKFGYAVVNSQVYYKDVSLFLEERRELLARLTEMDAVRHASATIMDRLTAARAYVASLVEANHSPESAAILHFLYTGQEQKVM